MRIASYNVNGLRACLRNGLASWLEVERPEVLCLQETKCTREQIDLTALEELGYKLYLFPALKAGYSGVGILTRLKPDFVGYGMGSELYDAEGRLMRMDFGQLTLLCVYHPSGSSGAERVDFKLRFLDDFSTYIRQLRQVRELLVVCGDFNICHEPIDIHDPVRNVRVSGFLPEERAWMTQWLAEGYVDAFRRLHPHEVAYSWWSYRSGARARNKGWRIDYTMISESLLPRLQEARIHTDAVHSDHCPVSLVLSE